MKKSAIAVLGATYTAYSSVRSTVQVVTHPVSWVRDQIKEYLIEKVVDLALFALKDEHKQKVRDTVANHQKTVTFTIPAPSVLHDTLAADTKALPMLHELANDALAAPLALLGYRLGKLHLAWDEEEKGVRATLEVGLSHT
jgi:hypothetical protein